MSPSKCLLALVALSACGGPGELDPFLVATPSPVFLGLDAPPVTVQLQNLRSFPVRITRIASPQDTLLLAHEPLPWNLAANSESAVAVSFQPWAQRQDATIEVEGPQGTLVIDVEAVTCDRDNDSFRGVQCGGDDCDDQSDLIFPGALELCNGLDDDCDGTVDEDVDTITVYADTDYDNFGDPDNPLETCGPVDGYVSNFGDCDDSNPYVNPDADEYCTGQDENCDGLIDYHAVDRLIRYADDDADGFGNPDIYARVCPNNPRYTNNAHDCNDRDDTAFPGAQEVCDGQDTNCDGQIDNTPTDELTGYADNDLDGYGDPRTPVFGCDLTGTVAPVADDCDDTNADRNPGAQETCDGLDNDCDNDVDEGVSDCLPDCSVPVGDLANTLANLRTTTPNILDTTGPSIAGNGNFARALTVADVNNDGCDDVVVSASTQQAGDERGVVYVFTGPITTALNTQDATATLLGDDPSFGQTLAVLPVQDAASRVAIGAPGDPTAAVYVFDAQGGAFTTQDATMRISHDADPAVESHLMGSGDIDDDGLTDLLISQYSVATSTLFGVAADWDGDVDALDAALFTAHSDSPDIHAAVLGDSNDDGFTDVVIRGSLNGTSRLAVFPGPVTGLLDLSLAAPTDSVGPLLSATGDLDADGQADFLYGYRYDTVNGVRFGYQLYPSGNPQPWTVRAGAVSQQDIEVAVASDLDADGYGDFTTTRAVGVCDMPERGTLSIGYGAKPSDTYIVGLSGRTVSGAELGDRLGEHIATGDLNGDGLQDLVATMPGWDTPASEDGGGVFVLYGLPRADDALPNALPTTAECEASPTEDLGDISIGYQFCLRTSEPVTAEPDEWYYDLSATVLTLGDVPGDAEWSHPGTRQHGTCSLPVVVATLMGDDGLTYEVRSNVHPTADTALVAGQRVRIGLAGRSALDTSSTVMWANQAIADSEGLVVAYHRGTPDWCRNPLSFHLWDMQDVCDTISSGRVTYRQRVNGTLLASEGTSRIDGPGGPLLFREAANRDFPTTSSASQRYKAFYVARDRTGTSR